MILKFYLLFLALIQSFAEMEDSVMFNFYFYRNMYLLLSWTLVYKLQYAFAYYALIHMDDTTPTVVILMQKLF